MFCRISDAVTLGPLLVAFDAGQGAGEGGATGTAVFVGVDVALKRWVVSMYCLLQGEDLYRPYCA